MLTQLLPIIAVISIALVFSPIYFLRRKTARMADDDLKKIDHEDWEKQRKFGIYTKLVSRVTWGGILFTVSLINVGRVEPASSAWLIAYIVGGILFVIWGLVSFRWELKNPLIR
jgi:hypothetical protein